MAKRKNLPKFKVSKNGKSYRLPAEVQLRLLDLVTASGATATDVVIAAVMQFGGDLRAVTHAASETNAVAELKQRIKNARKFATEVDAIVEMEWPRDNLGLKEQSLAEVKWLLGVKTREIVEQALVVAATAEKHQLLGLTKAQLNAAAEALDKTHQHFLKRAETSPPEMRADYERLNSGLEDAIKAVKFVKRTSTECEPQK
ncbi:hypothetical protein IMCC26134_09265 [Verrucomicrobia bacterium IMCC26134]|nr:hypothetical protein IMCC26134_09265 [Verrucomicrobia bacterium IMCC26134]